MFEFLEPITATLKTITPRVEMHGDQEIVAISMRLEIEGPNTLLDVLSPKLRHALYTTPENQDQLPGVEPSTPLLRFDCFERHTLKACFEGWTLRVDHGIDEGEPITMGSVKVDAFRIDAKHGGTVILSFRVGTSDVSDKEIGLLCGKLGSEISITLRAPEKPPEAIDASSSAKDLPPTAADLFAQQHLAEGSSGPQESADDRGEGRMGDNDPDDSWPLPDDAEPGTPPQSVVIELSQPGTRTARGRDKTKQALADGAKS